MGWTLSSPHLFYKNHFSSRQHAFKVLNRLWGITLTISWNPFKALFICSGVHPLISS